jgi:hypothetical protein
MKKHIFILFILFVIVTLQCFSQKKDQKLEKSSLKFSIPIDTMEVKADEKFLASYELEGREISGNGIKAAAKYIATQFEGIGLRSFGNSYIQKFFAKAKSIKDSIETANVIGYIEGSDPKLKTQFIIFSAHYDHLGISKEGEVYNGADDNASGVTSVMNIAKAIQKSKVKPKRSLMFIAFSGEEKGLLGSYNFVNYPMVPINNIYAVLNMDMIGRTDPKHDSLGIRDYIYVIGPKISGGKSVKIIEQVNKESGNINLDYSFDILSDPNRWFFRSDHFPFAKQGRLGIRFFDGGHIDYHKTTDKIEKIDFELLYKRMNFIGYLGLKFASLKEEIKLEKLPDNIKR